MLRYFLHESDVISANSSMYVPILHAPLAPGLTMMYNKKIESAVISLSSCQLKTSLLSPLINSMLVIRMEDKFLPKQTLQYKLFQGGRGSHAKYQS